MRIFYLLIFLITSVAFSASAQVREDLEVKNHRIDQSSVHLFPNPAVDFVHIRVESVPVRELKISVHNIIGNVVPVETEVVDEHELRVRVKDLTSGYYLLAVKDDTEHFRGTYKFLKR